MATPDIETDVLVVGGGLAGLRAGIAARSAGARVLIAVKGKLGRSGSSAMTTAGYAAAMPDAGDSIALHAADTFRGGARVGVPELVDALCQETTAEARHLEALGAAFQRDGATYRLSLSGDHSRARVLLTPNNLGTDLTVPLAAHAEALGVAALEFVMIVALVRGDDGVDGAIGFDYRKGRFVTIAAGATVLATGGAGRLFSVTSNPNDVTGDGFALAAGAGAALRDMEFIQFYPWRCIDPFDKARVSIQPSTFVLGATLHNAVGERFMERFNPGGAEVSTRDISARGIFLEIRDGRGIAGGVRLDLSPLSPDAFATSNPKVARYLDKLGIDYASYPFIVTPEAHFWMGGVSIDASGRSSVNRLFAAGETAGGVHGANRLNSNAIPETQVFGARAGAAAAEAAMAARSSTRIAATIPSPMRERGLATSELATMHGALQRCAWDALGILRTGSCIDAGLRDVRAMASALAARGAADAGAIRPWYELTAQCVTAELSLVAASARRESRGAHFREDFPHTDDARWGGSIVVTRSASGSVDTAFVPLKEIGHAA